MKNKKPIIALAILAGVGLVGATIAYFTSEVTLDNVFTTATYKTKTTETFSSPTDWLPGTTTAKTVVTENEGTIPVVVRASLAENCLARAKLRMLGVALARISGLRLAIIIISTASSLQRPLRRLTQRRLSLRALL